MRLAPHPSHAPREFVRSVSDVVVSYVSAQGCSRAIVCGDRANEMFSGMDDDNSGQISYEEFGTKWSADAVAILPDAKK